MRYRVPAANSIWIITGPCRNFTSILILKIPRQVESINKECTDPILHGLLMR